MTELLKNPAIFIGGAMIGASILFFSLFFLRAVVIALGMSVVSAFEKTKNHSEYLYFFVGLLTVSLFIFAIFLTFLAPKMVAFYFWLVIFVGVLVLYRIYN